MLCGRHPGRKRSAMRSCAQQETAPVWPQVKGELAARSELERQLGEMRVQLEGVSRTQLKVRDP